MPRKRIEDAIELVRRLDLPSTLLISRAAGDKGRAYEDYLRSYAELLGICVIFAVDRVGDERGVTPEGGKIFSLADAANLVTYPSVLEGFGNAFLEAVYYRRPIIMRNYEIFTVDIQPKGFKVITFGDFITQGVVEETRRLLQNPSMGAEMSEHNYEIARRYYSYRVLEQKKRIGLNS